MILSFGLLLLLALAGLGRDGRDLPLFALACALCVLTVARGAQAAAGVVLLLALNGGASVFLSRFAPYAPGKGGVLPVLATLALLLALGFAGTGFGLAPSLAAAVVLAGLCGVAAGPPLAQFAAFARMADGLIVLACALGSWALLAGAAAFWAVLAALGAALLPRLAWRRAE